MEISNGSKNGLPHFIELVSYHNDVRGKFIQIESNEFCKTPDGTRCFENSLPSIIISDQTKYGDYCEQFGDAAIQGAINDFLSQKYSG